METTTREVSADEAHDAILAGAPDVVQPQGRQIVECQLRGVGTQLIDEDFDQFCARFQAFMDEEHTRGELFHFTTFYSWPVDTAGVTKMHIRREQGAWTQDGCQDVTAIGVQYLKEEPIEQRRPQGPRIVRADGMPVSMHGPGKRGR